MYDYPYNLFISWAIIKNGLHRMQQTFVFDKIYRHGPAPLNLNFATYLGPLNPDHSCLTL